MTQYPPRKRFREAMERVRRFFKREPEPPDDPYALVGAPKQPRLPRRSAGAEAPLE
jgi:hypothetical protein